MALYSNIITTTYLRYICYTMKTETLNLRVEPKVKEALRTIASKERRTLANMVEFLIVDYCKRVGESFDSDQIVIPFKNSNTSDNTNR